MLNNNFSVIGVAITNLYKCNSKNATDQRYEFILEMTTRHSTNQVQITVVPGILINKIQTDLKDKQIMVSGYLDSKKYVNDGRKELYFNKVIATEIVVLSEDKIDQPVTFKETYQDED